jgi:enoyl-CoA hydratase
MGQEHLIVEDIADSIRVITLNRPERLNALSRAMVAGLERAFADADQGGRIRVIVLRGAGRAFSVGADLREPTTHATESVADALEMFLPGRDILPTCRLPIIASVHGYCCGAGFEIALACDMLVCSESAQFWFPQTSLGLFPGAGGTVRLAKAVGKALAMDIVLTGRRISGAEAFRVGLASRLYPDDAALADGSLQLAREIAEKGPLGIMFAKQSIIRGLELPIADALLEDGMRLFPLYATEDRKEASRAWLEKRSPNFRGR